MSYTVKKGDNLTKIAKQHGLTLQELMKLNNISQDQANRINIGQKLKVSSNPIGPQPFKDLKLVKKQKSVEQQPVKQLVKKQQPIETKSEPQMFGAGPEYAVMAQAQMLKKDPSKDTLGNGIKSSIPYRMIYQASQAIKDGYNNVSEELSQGNYGRAAFSALGTALDLYTIPGTAIGLKIAPSYAMPLKDIPITGFNRLSRYIFNDENYTAINGRHYSNNDYSAGVNRVAKELMQSGKDVGKPIIDKKIKKEVDPNLDYGSPQLLKYPFNPTAAYAWTIGQQSVKTNEDGSIESVGDPFDNAMNKTKHYLNTGKQDLFRRMRGIGGLFTAYDEDPDEGKQITTFRY